MTRKSACHCINIRRAGNIVTDLYNSHLAKAGVTVSQYSLIVNIMYAPPSTIDALAEQMGLERTTLLRNLKRLEKEGLIRDTNSKGRARQVALTDKGIEVMREAMDLWEEAQQCLEEKLGDEGIKHYEAFISQVLSIRADGST